MSLHPCTAADRATHFKDVFHRMMICVGPCTEALKAPKRPTTVSISVSIKLHGPQPAKVPFRILLVPLSPPRTCGFLNWHELLYFAVAPSPFRLTLQRRVVKQCLLSVTGESQDYIISGSFRVTCPCLEMTYSRRKLVFPTPTCSK